MLVRPGFEPATSGALPTELTGRRLLYKFALTIFFFKIFTLSGESVDVVRLFSLFALDVIMRAAFGMEADIQLNPDPEFVQKARTVFRTPLWIRFFSMFPFWKYFSR